MSRGILDDIITQVNSMKQVPLEWMESEQPAAFVPPEEAMEEPVHEEIRQPTVEQAILQQRTSEQIFEEIPQEVEHVEQEFAPQELEYFDYAESIENLYEMLAGLPAPDLEAAFEQLLAVTEALGEQLEEYQSMKPAVELEPSKTELSQQSLPKDNLFQQVEARRQLNRSQRQDAVSEATMLETVGFPGDFGRERWTDALLGESCQKIQRITLDSSEKFFWLDKNVRKVFWSAREGEPACGSFSLSNIKYILVGQLSVDFVKGKISFKDLRPDCNSGNAPAIPQLSFLNDKRDVNLLMTNVQECEVWTAAALELDDKIQVIF